MIKTIKGTVQRAELSLFVFNHRQKKKSLLTRRTFSFDHWMGEKENRLGNVTLFTI